MNRFQALFGLKDTDVEETCLLLPCLPKGILKDFGVDKLSKAKLYPSAINKKLKFTVILTGVGAGFVGDAVLHLKETPCRRVILFGSCGLINSGDFSLGGLVLPDKCAQEESFTRMLLEKERDKELFFPDNALFDQMINYGVRFGLKRGACLTISSLKLEEDRFSRIKESGFDVVDMECSAFFSAAGYSKLAALALFYVSDIIKVQPFYMELDSLSKNKLNLSVKSGARLLCEFIETKFSA
jgi:purine-nucleoside phosphorylase